MKDQRLPGAPYTSGGYSTYVPSRREEVREAFLKLRPVGKEDLVVDFGCGDGVVLGVAASFGAKAVGVELNPFLVWVARWRNRRKKGVRVICGDAMMVRLPEGMTVAYVFGLDIMMRRLLPRLRRYAREEGREIFVISHAFEFPGVRALEEFGSYRLYKIS